ncbi:nuclear transport factor 2 family protein [Mycobacterium sp. SMC-8]|uniref:nuclear transport factor 2 family protein n=1 Tax=Mycobacterium sp. SMC-8 TaxID=2857060 RepID=UPI0021B3AFE6|nr:nuclear transport factor 2 family protein [Mycobacterium sp. SMC-8]UXA11493.1 nuclear transport factor 2 family protein [Mycobacterium sp. SMC-8]
MKHDRGAEGVRYLVAEYCHAIDSGETERWTALFDDDARFTIDDLGELVRPENISVFVDGALTSLREHGIAGINHRTVNSAIDLDGDRATVTSDFAVVVPVPDGFATAALGRYLDELRHDGDRWHFVARRITWFGGAAPAALAEALRPVFADRSATAGAVTR